VQIHESARIGFQREAEAYERGRPDYPPEAIAWLAERLELGPGRTVADVGAGTGKLTRALLATGAQPIAVEPVQAMRRVLRRAVPGVRALAGTAEQLPLADDSVDAIVAGQAFHWFDPLRAPHELARVLRPGGRLGLIWNRRDTGQPLQRELDRLLEPHRRGTPSHASGAWREGLEQSGLFALAAEHAVPFEQPLDPEGVGDRIGSISFIAALPPRPRRELLERVRELAERHPESLRHRSEAYVFVARSPG
jgi:SAM-dependent methyltransferase